MTSASTSIDDVIKEGLPHGAAAARLQTAHQKIYSSVIDSADRFAEMILAKGGTDVVVYDSAMAGQTEEALEISYQAFNEILDKLKAAKTSWTLPQDTRADYDLGINLTRLLIKSAQSIAFFYEQTVPGISSIIADTKIKLPNFGSGDLMAAGQDEGHPAVEIKFSMALNRNLVDAFRARNNILKPQFMRHDRNATTEDILLGQIREAGGKNAEEIIAIWKANYKGDVMGRNLLTYGKTALYLAAVQVDPLCAIPKTFMDPVQRLMFALETHPLSKPSAPAPDL